MSANFFPSPSNLLILYISATPLLIWSHSLSPLYPTLVGRLMKHLESHTQAQNWDLSVSPECYWCSCFCSLSWKLKYLLLLVFVSTYMAWWRIWPSLVELLCGGSKKLVRGSEIHHARVASRYSLVERSSTKSLWLLCSNLAYGLWQQFDTTWPCMVFLWVTTWMHGSVCLA